MDLRTEYLGLRLKNPIVPSAGPVSRELDAIRRLEDAGAGAVVLYSLFEEQIERELRETDDFLMQGTNGFAEALTYFPDASTFARDPQAYLEHIARAKAATDIPIIASLNAVSKGAWIQYARDIQRAGADALELNLYYVPTDPLLSASEIETNYIETVRAVVSVVDIPVAVKLSPYFTNVAAIAREVLRVGAKGLVLFNRFYQPDIDLEDLEVVPHVTFSTAGDLRIVLRWVAILRASFDASLAGSSGVRSAADVIKLVMVGADVTMMCAALIQQGPGHIRDVLEGVREWLVRHEYGSLLQLRGSMSHRNVADPASFERAHYVRALNAF